MMTSWAMLASITWERPAMWLALPVIFMPLWLARRYRERRRPVYLPTAELLRGLHRASPVHDPAARRVALLVVVRMLLLAGMVGAFAGPQWLGDAHGAPGVTTEPMHDCPNSPGDMAAGQQPEGEPDGQAGAGRPVTSPRPLVLVLGSYGVPGGPSAADLLARALAPHNDGADRWQVLRRAVDEMNAAQLVGVQQIWWVADEPVSPAVLMAIRGAVRGVMKHGVDMVCVVPDAMDAWLGETVELPLVLVGRRDPRDAVPAVSPVLPDGSALSPSLARALSQAVVLPRWHTRAARGAIVHLELADGEPVIAEAGPDRAWDGQAVGPAGRVIAVALDLAWHAPDMPAADLPRRGAFAWLVQVLADHLAETDVPVPSSVHVAEPASTIGSTLAEPLPLTPPSRVSGAPPRMTMPLSGLLLLAAMVLWILERVLTCLMPGETLAS